MKKSIVSSVVFGIVGISTLVAGCGQPVTNAPAAAAAAAEATNVFTGSNKNQDFVFDEGTQQWMAVEIPEYVSANIETIVTGPDGQQVILNSFDGSMVNLDGSLYQPMPVVEQSAPVQSAFQIQRATAAEPVEWDIDGNPVYSRENPILPSGIYDLLAPGEIAPPGSRVTPTGRVLVRISTENTPAVSAVTAAPMTHHELVALLKTLDERWEVLLRAGPASPDQMFELQATDDARQNILARIATLEGSAFAPTTPAKATLKVAAASSQTVYDEVVAQVAALGGLEEFIEYQKMLGWLSPEDADAQLQVIEEARKQALARIGLTD
ncbi:MAG: hypothetical protein HYX80_04630 [Chloroflexi bacterium]|nr:hypothetical protein [Chloroflexota bacterium]